MQFLPTMPADGLVHDRARVRRRGVGEEFRVSSWHDNSLTPSRAVRRSGGQTAKNYEAHDFGFRGATDASTWVQSR